MQPSAVPAAAPVDSQLACAPDPGFAQWLAASGGSVAVSTYQAGKLLLIGWNGRQLTFLPRHFDKPMGLDLQGERLALATRHGITIFANDRVLAHHYENARPGRYDALYLPRLTWHTADLNVHDLALTADDLWFVNTRFSCLAGLSDRYSFVSRWRPKFVSDDVPEDRCHLNGLAMVAGRPGYVTALGATDSAGGWRENKASGGLLMHVDSQQIVLGGLSMPHSPRWHDDALWVLNSGSGELLRVDPARGTADVICALPAYLRGLTFVGRHALVGMCKIRETNIFGGLPVQARHPVLSCGVALIDLASGTVAGTLEFTAGCTEIYDLRFLAGLQRPNVLNLEREQARQAFNAPDLHYWLRPENEVKE